MLNPVGVDFLESEDKEEDLVAKEAKLYVIIVGILDILTGTTRVFPRHLCTTIILVILLRNALSLFQDGGIRMWETRIHCRIPIWTPIRISRRSMLNQGIQILMLWQEEVLWMGQIKIDHLDNRRCDQQHHSMSKKKRKGSILGHTIRILWQESSIDFCYYTTWRTNIGNSWEIWIAAPKATDGKP